MAAYVISELSEVTDSRLMEDYRSLAQAAIEQYGGRYIVRGGAFETVEGDSRPCRVVIVEFPTLQKAREWYHSPEYAKALTVGQKAFKRRLIIVEGVQRDIR
jgi:uncharacterized protein (DUF1330 family)